MTADWFRFCLFRREKCAYGADGQEGIGVVGLRPANFSVVGPQCGHDVLRSFRHPQTPARIVSPQETNILVRLAR